MKRTTAVVASIATLALTASLAGCKVVPPSFKGTPVTEDRTVTAFDSIELRGVGDITVVAGEELSLSVRADESAIAGVRTSVEGTTLVISEDDKASSERIEIVIHVPTLSSVEVLGAGTITVTGLDVERFAIAVAGAGDATVSGRATTVVAVLTGVGSIDASALAGTDVTARLAGVGSLSLNASRTLDAELGGVGDITYTGDPVVTSKVSGVGEIAHK
jgi:hypothetical protein